MSKQTFQLQMELKRIQQESEHKDVLLEESTQRNNIINL